MSKNILLLISLILQGSFVGAQSLTQTVRGKISDSQSGFPLVGATVVVVGTDPLI